MKDASRQLEEGETEGLGFEKEEKVVEQKG
jgi:hypothetical protein